MHPLAAHWDLDPAVTHLNHGSFGACPRELLALQRRLQRRIEANAMEALVRSLESDLDRARAALAGFVGCDPLDLVFVPNATTGVNAVLRSLSLQPGDQLLVTDHAYNACRNALEFVAERAGAQVVVAAVPFPLDDPQQVIDAVLAAVGDRTRLALLDHITSATGLVLPMAALVAALRERGVATLIDGAHVPGHVPLDLRALDPDYFTGNCHKWLCTPKGAAMLYVRRSLQPSVRPTVISHGANAQRSDRSRFLLEFDWPGTHDPSPYLVVEHALTWLPSLVEGGWPEIMRRNHALALQGRQILLDALGVAAPAPASMIGNLATVPLPEAIASQPTGTIPFHPIQHELQARHGIEVPVFVWPARPHESPGSPRAWVRISAQLYNEPAEYERLAQALCERLGR